MAKIDELVVTVRANLGNFKNQMRNVAKSASDTTKRTRKAFSSMNDKLNSSFDKLGETVNKFRGALSLAAGAAGIGFLAKQALNAADEIGKLSSNVGINTDLLQELSFAASMTGVSQEDLNSSLLRFNRRLADAAAGSAEFAKGFESLGVQIKDNNGALRPTEEVLKEVADGVNALGSESAQASALFKVFGDSGFKLVNLFKGGSADIEAFAKEAKDLGLVLDSESIAAAEKANDEFDKLSKLISGQFTMAVANNAELIGQWTRDFIESTKTVIGWGQAIGQVLGVGKSLEQQLESEKERLRELEDAQSDVVNNWLNIVGLGSDVNSAIEEQKNKIVALEAEINGANATKERELEIEEERRNSAAATSAALAKQKEEELAAKKALEEAQEARRQAAEEGKELAEELILQQEENSELKLELLEEEKARELEILQTARDKDLISEDQFIEAKNELQKKQQAREKKRREEEGKRKIENAKQTLKQEQEFIGNIQSLAKGNSKELFEITKKAQLAMAVVRGFSAIQAALASAPFPANLYAAALVAAQSASNIKAIQAQSFNRGIDSVPGIGSKDTVPAILTPGERVVPKETNKDLKRFLEMQNDRGGEMQVNVNIGLNDNAIDIIEAALIERGNLNTGLQVS